MNQSIIDISRSDEIPLPTLTIIIPCLNEAAFIKQTLLGIVQGDYPEEQIEILVIDGMSTDGTRDIITDLTLHHSQIRMLDNPGASKPRALNIGIASGKGEIMMRLDAHASYPGDYASKLVRSLYSKNADNVGGIRRNISRGDGVLADTLAKVLTLPFGVGDARHYTGVEAAEETDIVFLFCVRKELFNEVGNFDERLTRGQDREFNLRLTRLGKRLLLIPDVECTYFTRDKLSSFTSWALDAGATPFRISYLTGHSLISFRNLIPLALVLWLLCLGIAGIFWKTAWGMLLLTLLTYFIFALTASATVAIKDRVPVYVITLPFAFFLWHITYGIGTISALLDWRPTRARQV